MFPRELDQAIEVVEKAATAGAAVAAIAGAGAAAVPVVAAVEPVVEMGRALVEVAKSVREGRLERLLRELYCENVSDRAFAADFRGRVANDPQLRDVLLESVRASMDSISEEVVPAIAAIAREYERTGAPVDGFFRGYCRTLMDLSGDEYQALARLIWQAADVVANDVDEGGEVSMAA